MKMTGNPCAEWELECEGIDPLNPAPCRKCTHNY